MDLSLKLNLTRKGDRRIKKKMENKEILVREVKL